MRRKDPPPSIRATEVLFHVEHTRLASTCLPSRRLWIDGQVFHVKPGTRPDMLGLVPLETPNQNKGDRRRFRSRRGNDGGTRARTFTDAKRPTGESDQETAEVGSSEIGSESHRSPTLRQR